MTDGPDFSDLNFNADNITAVWEYVHDQLTKLGTVKQRQLAEETAEATDTYPTESLRKAVLPAMARALQEQNYIAVEVTDEAEKRERIKEKYWTLTR